MCHLVSDEVLSDIFSLSMATMDSRIPEKSSRFSKPSRKRFENFQTDSLAIMLSSVPVLCRSAILSSTFQLSIVYTFEFGKRCQSVSHAPILCLYFRTHSSYFIKLVRSFSSSTYYSGTVTTVGSSIGL